MLSVENLRASYGRIPILMGVNFQVSEGEFVGILGHNGMGKTTLLKALIGQLSADTGRIRLDGADITRLPPSARARAGIGYVPQGREIFPALSVRENLRMGCLLSKLPEAATIDDVPDILPAPDQAAGSSWRRAVRRGAAIAGARPLPVRCATPDPA